MTENSAASRTAHPPSRAPLSRARDFVRGVLVNTVDAVRPVPAGLVVTTPSLPSVWSANQLRVTEPASYDELVDLVDEELSWLGYLDIALEHEESGPQLEEEFRAANWKVERDVLMILSASPDKEADTGVVVETSEDESMELMARWYSEDPGPTLMAREELVEFTRREIRIHGDRLLGVRSSDGQLVAMTKLRMDGCTAEVEDVYTVPEARGRGYARAMVLNAVDRAQAAGTDVIFITADDNDWPKLLYARLGFRAAGHVWHFHRQ